jgi:hypothetical protein
MVIQRSLISIVAIDQAGGWGVDLWRMRSAIVVTTHRIDQFYV